MLTFLVSTYLNSNQIILSQAQCSTKVAKSGCYYTVTVFSEIFVTLLKGKMQKEKQKKNTEVGRTEYRKCENE